MKSTFVIFTISFIIWAVVGITPSEAQSILIDQQISAGGLNLFQVKDKPLQYRYLPNKIQLAKENGRPKFSFLRYVYHEEDGQPSSSGSSIVKGGGVVNFVVELKVSEGIKQKALAELQQKVPGATIIGPVFIESGTMTLVSFVIGEEFSHKIIGVSSAPILEGSRAGVSMHLTTEGARILWNTFDMENSGLAVGLEMVVPGYLSPKKLVVKANFDKMYTSHDFGLGLATPYLQADIMAAFERVRQTNIIEVPPYEEDEGFEKILNTVYTKLLEMMFDKLNGSGVPDMQTLTQNIGGKPSMSERAGRCWPAGNPRIGTSRGVLLRVSPRPLLKQILL